MRACSIRRSAGPLSRRRLGPAVKYRCESSPPNMGPSLRRRRSKVTRRRSITSRSARRLSSNCARWQKVSLWIAGHRPIRLSGAHRLISPLKFAFLPLSMGCALSSPICRRRPEEKLLAGYCNHALLPRALKISMPSSLKSTRALLLLQMELRPGSWKLSPFKVAGDKVNS